MKLWQQLLTIDHSIGYNREMLLEICKLNSRCPATIEAKYHLIGDRRLERFCKDGCSVICMDEYLDIEIRRNHI